LLQEASALDVWEANAALLRAWLPQAQPIEAAIANCDFEEALKLLG
jgi:hypothetical protein